VEPSGRPRDDSARLFRTPIKDGEADWLGSWWSEGVGRNDSGARSGNRDDNAAESEAAGTTTKAEKLIGHGGIGSFTMPKAGADSLLIYGFTAMIAHLLMSLGQTLFHRHLGHSRLGGRFFNNHVQFHHVHYAGEHVVSTHYLDNGDNNTLFFVMPVALIVGVSYLLLKFDLFVVQLAAMSLSFCGHYYIDNQYHVAGSWLGRFSWFRRKQQLHCIHHRHGNCNFAVIDFFWDRFLGTYRPVEAGEPRPRRRGRPPKETPA
jgi:sterol desaturase/sphingolipid hydroxylase (fatty acid hydroxylase superfamily)